MLKQFASGSSSAPNSNHDDDAGGREYETEDISFPQTTKTL